MFDSNREALGCFVSIPKAPLKKKKNICSFIGVNNNYRDIIHYNIENGNPVVYMMALLHNFG